jgi:hypothetical protein
MTLSMTAQIAAADICDVKCYKDLKVYLLRGTDGSELVIKTDAVRDAQIKNTGQVVKAIDPVAKMKILTATELQELKNYCKYVDDLDLYFAAVARDTPEFNSPVERQRAACDLLKESLSFGFPFTKMQKQTIHNLEDAAAARGQGSKDLMRQFVAALKVDGGLERLGVVIAADLFNGNTDRFFPLKTATAKAIGPFTFNLRVTVNMGNVMLIAGNGGLQATALDYVDPNSTFKDYSNKFSAQESKDWPGRVLADGRLRHKFVEDVIHDLESLFNPKKSAFSLRTKLGRDAVSRLEKGMKDGTRTIRAALANRANKPPGLVDRLAIIANV